MTRFLRYNWLSVCYMEKGQIRFIMILLVIIALSGVLFGVLYGEQERRLIKAERARQAFFEEQRAALMERKKYLDAIAAQKTELRAEMVAARDQYDQLLRNQAETIKQSQTTTTQVKTVPVQTTAIKPTTASRPVATRKTKTS